MTSVVLDDDMRGCVERLLRCLHDPLERQIWTGAGARIVVHRVARAAGRCAARTGGTAGAIPGRGVDQSPACALHRTAECRDVGQLREHERFVLSRALQAQHVVVAGAVPQAPALAQGADVAGRRLGVAQVAHRVGYQSTSQFSREYKRYFERSPGDERVA
jgi:hypothetical protein